MFITAVLLLSLTAFFTLWILFLAVMNLQGAASAIEGAQQVCSIPSASFGLYCRLHSFR